MYVDIMYTRTFGKRQLVKQLCACYKQVIFMTKNAVAVEKDGRIIGHLPWKVSRFRAFFLKIHVGGTIRCTVTGRCLMVGNTASKSR